MLPRNGASQFPDKKARYQRRGSVETEKLFSLCLRTEKRSLMENRSIWSSISKESQASERARPPVLEAVSRRSIANSSPKCMSRIMVQRLVTGKRVILLGGSEDVQGGPAPQGGAPASSKGNTGAMRASAHKSRKSVTGVVFVVIGRDVVAGGPHGEAAPNFSPHRPLRVPACAPTAPVAAAPPTLSGA